MTQLSTGRGLDSLLATALVDGSRVVGKVVPLSFATAAAMPVADAVFALSPGRREVTARNIARVMGLTPDNPQVKRAARAAFRHFGRFVAESIHAQSWGNEDIADRVDVEGTENLDLAAASGRGVIFVSAHMGATEVAAALAVLRGFQVAAVMEEVRPRWLMETALISRERMGVTLLTPSGAGISLVRRLRRGGMAAFVIDAGLDRPDTLPVTFFGRETRFPEGPARLARLTGAPVVFGAAVRIPHGRYRAVIHPPLYQDSESNAETAIHTLTQEIARTFEDFVRPYPSQWYAFRDMWPGR
jgi:KDO2-lipid IV(A) lauroyltransferase